MIRLKKIILLFLLAGITPCLYASSKNMKYYEDGIFDGYTQVSKDLKSGIDEHEMTEYQNSYLVIKHLKDFAIPDIIFFKTIAVRNNLYNAAVVRDIETNEDYIVFGFFPREADAIFANQRLLESGVEAKVQYNSTLVYRRNPIIVKKYLNDMKNILSSMPVKVIVVDKYIVPDPKNTPQALADQREINQTLSDKEKQQLENEYKQINEWFQKGKFSTSKSAFFVFHPILKTWNGYGEGDPIKSFTVKRAALKKAGVFEVILEDRVGNQYVMLRKFGVSAAQETEAEDKKTPQANEIKKAGTAPKDDNQGKAISAPKAATKKDPVPESETIKGETSKRVQKDSMICDFSKVRTLKIDGNTVQTKDTLYANESLEVRVLKKTEEGVIIKNGSRPKAVISNLYFQRHCKDAE
jgi:hypothetical protein